VPLEQNTSYKNVEKVCLSTHRSLTFQVVVENYPLKRPIFERLDDNRSSRWQRSLIVISSILAEWEMNTVFWAFFGPRERRFHGGFPTYPPLGPAETSSSCDLQDPFQAHT
jgi:hypothetical protein